MKKITLASAFVAALLLAGCESSSLENAMPLVTLGPREAPRSRVYDADQRATYEAAKAVVNQMGYRITHGGPAEGEIVALSGVARGDEVGGARQISMKIELEPGPQSGTEMVLSITEIIEGDSSNLQSLATQTPLKDTPLYDDFFARVQAQLSADAKQK